MSAARPSPSMRSSGAGAEPSTGAPGLPVSPPASTNTATSLQPICRSQDAVMTARTSASSTSTMRAPSVPTYWSVACTSCPPGRGDRSGNVPGLVFAGIAHVEEVERAFAVGAPALQRAEIDAGDAEAVRHAGGCGPGPGEAVGRYAGG